MNGDESPEVKVTDRRHFHADGTPRSDAASGAEAEAGHPAAEAAVHFESDSQPPPAEASARALTFIEFLAGFVGGAASYLGLAPHPATGKAEVDLNGAKQMIDILALLEEKTKGNVTPEEKRFLENALTELRLVYVRLASQPK